MIAICVYKRVFAAQKAGRFFKERGVKFQTVDMWEKGPGKKELQLFAQGSGFQTCEDSIPGAPAVSRVNLTVSSLICARRAGIISHNRI